ncbi:MAG: disulfide bond formation protein B [Telluria sp.]
MAPTPRTILTATAAYCLVLIGIALYLQHTQYMLPCPLCVIQRYCYLGIALFAALGAALRRPRLGAGLAMVSAVIGLGTVAKHLYVLAHPGFSCGIDPMETMLNKIPTATALPWLFRADGLCENALDTVVGLTIPQWSAIGFTLAAIALAWVLARTGKRA